METAIVAPDGLPCPDETDNYHPGL
eukprot:SAG31_NODE_25591_length_456_cov_1.142061_1_plen_24_part_10